MPWKYYLPDGNYYTLSDSVTKDQADDAARKKHPELFAPPESTMGGAFMHGLKSLGSQVQTLAEVPFKGADVAAERAARRERGYTEQYGTGASFENLSKKYEEQGLFPAAGEVVHQAGLALAQSVPYMAGLGASSFFGGVPGLVAGAYAPRVASGIEEQAATQKAEGKPVDVSLGKAAAYGVPLATLDVAAQAIPLGKTVAGKIFGPEVEKLLARGKLTDAEKAARGAMSSMARGVGKNLVAQELIQPTQVALSRLQNGQDLTGPEALSAYGEAMYMAGIMSPLGAVEGVSERSEAGRRIAEQAKRVEEEKPGVEETTGQSTFAPNLFTYDQEKFAANSRFELLKQRMQQALKRNLTPAEEKALREDVEAEMKPEGAISTPAEVGPSRQMGLNLRPQEMTEQQGLFSSKEAPQPAQQLDMFGMPFEEPAPEATPIYNPEARLKELQEQAKAEGRVLTPEEEAQATQRPVAAPNTAQTEMPFTGVQEGLGFEEQPTTQFDLGAEAQQRAVEAPITARNQVEREAARNLDIENYIRQNEVQLPLPFPELGGKLPEEPVAPEVTAEKTPDQIAREKAIEVILKEDKATIASVKRATGLSDAKVKELLDQLTAEGFLTKPDPTTVRKIRQPVKQLEMDLSEQLPTRSPRAGEQMEMFSPEETYTNKPFSIKDLSDEKLKEIYGVEQPVEGDVTTPYSGQDWLPGMEPRWQHQFDTEAEARQRAAGEAIAERNKRVQPSEESKNAPSTQPNAGRNARPVSGERPNKRGVPTGTEQRIPQRETGKPDVTESRTSGLAADKSVAPELTGRTGKGNTPLTDLLAEKLKRLMRDGVISKEQEKNIRAAIERVKTGLRTPEEVERIIKKTAASTVVSKLSAKWKNGPKVNVISSIEELPERLRNSDPTAKGLYDPVTKTIYILSHNADSADVVASVKATLFHEALGHFGLDRAFGAGLDSMLKGLYEKNKALRNATDNWLTRNPDAYKDSPTRIARAAEEVFAELSEKGDVSGIPLSIRTALDAVVKYIRSFLEKMGLPSSEYKDKDMREIFATLQRAHEAVSKGEAPVKAKGERSTETRYQRQSEGIIQDDIPEDTGTAKAAEAARKIQEARDTGNPKEELDRYGDAELHLVTMDRSRKSTALAALSRLKTGLKDVVQDGLSLFHKHQLYGDKLPSLGLLDARVNARGAELKARQEVLSKQMKGWLEELADKKKYTPAVMKNFYDIAIRSTLDQVELLGNEKRNRVREEGTLAKRFDALPKPLQEMYSKMRDSYEDMMHEYTDFVTKGMKPDDAAKFRAEFESSRLKVYLPLFRHGEFWVSYTDKAGNPVKSSYDTEYERNAEVAKLKQAGFKDVETYRNVRHMRETGGPPTGFLGGILKALDAQGIKDPEILDAVYETYLDYLPASSLRQRFRARERYLGMEPDIFNAYANVANGMTRLINSMKHAPGLDEAMAKIYEEAAKHRDDSNIAGVVKSVAKQMEFIRNPKVSRLATMAGYGSYMWYLAGNASSALINVSHLPMVVYPMLGGKYGYGESTTAFKKAWSSVKMQWEDQAPKGYEKLYEAATKAGALGIHIGHELFDVKKASIDDYTGTYAKVKFGMDYMFRVTDKLNREAALVAAYELELKKTGNVETAHKAAIELVKEAYGSALAEAGPRIMQNNIARVALTFKSFALNRAFILGRMFHKTFKGESKEVRTMARNQVLGVYAMAFAFSGVAGMPLVGIMEYLANQLMGDEDDPFDAEAAVRTATGDLAYKGPLAHALNLSVSERTGWNDMLWKDDPRKLADIGVLDYTLQQSMGPMYNVVSQWGDAYDYFKQGKYDRMFESALPVAIRNVFKGVRYYTEGAQTVTGKPLGEVSAYNALMQIAGFAPEDLAMKRQQATSMTEEQRKIFVRRNALIDQAEGAYRTGNSDGIDDVNQAIQRFNAKNPEKPITYSTIITAINNAKKKEREAVLGINPDKKLAARLLENQGLDYSGSPID